MSSGNLTKLILLPAATVALEQYSINCNAHSNCSLKGENAEVENIEPLSEQIPIPATNYVIATSTASSLTPVTVVAGMPFSIK